MRKTSRELREARGASRSQVARALGVMPQTVVDGELGRSEPTIARFRALTEHFGVRDDQITLQPGQPPTLAERLADAR
jgi:transcriptional regulator with XRE-family HTH domain